MKKIILGFILSFLIVQEASACGVLLSEEGTNVRANHFEVIMNYDGKKKQEDLIIKIGYLQNEGETESFGWLMPFPTKPDVNETDEDIFERLAKETEKKENSLQKILNYKQSWGFSGGSDKSAGFSKGGEISVIEEKTVGAFDTAIVQAERADGLKKWAKDNDYHISWEKTGMLEEYVAKKWYFVLMKMNKGESESGNTQATKFSFKTKEPIFPIQLTKYDRFGKHNPEKTIPITLYILSDEKLKPTNYDLNYQYGSEFSDELKDEFKGYVFISKWEKILYGEEIKDEMFFAEDEKMENKNDGSMTITDTLKLMGLLVIFPYFTIYNLLVSGGTFAVFTFFAIALVIMHTYAREKGFKELSIALYNVFGFIAIFYMWSVYPYYVICYVTYHVTRYILEKKKSR